MRHVTEHSPAKTGEYPGIFPNFRNCEFCEKRLKDNKHNSCSPLFLVKTFETRQKTRQLYYIFAHDTVMTDLALQVAEANRGGPGARFSKLMVITGPVKLFCFPFQMGVSKHLKVIR